MMESESSSLLPSSLALSATAVLITTFVVLISLHHITSLIARTKQAGHAKSTTVPEAKGSWPLLGHLPLLGGPSPPHIVLARMADKYGPIFAVRLGIHRSVVANTWEIAKECLTTNDRVLATRPQSVGSEVMAYNYAMLGLSSYGPYWREVRKISTLKLLSNHQIELLRHVRDSEVLASVRSVYDQCDSKKPLLVDMKRWFGDITVNSMFRMIVGKRFKDGDEGDEKAREALRDFFDLIGRFVISDGLPFLRWLDLGGHEKAMKRTAKELDRIMQGWLEERRVMRKKIEEAGGAKSDQDFMDAMLSMVEHRSLDNNITQSYDADTVIKATCMSLILAGTDTTTVTMTWALSLLLNNKQALKRVQEELDARVGRHRRIEEADLKDLPYLQAIIKETLRLYPAGPLSLPHEATEDCTVSGYIIPKGTRLLFNLYKIQRDPRVWADPLEFRPERFLTTHKDLDVRGQNFEYIPFGSWRRMCPGVSLALNTLGISLGSFLHAFDVATPGDEVVDMEEAIGLTNLKASPLDVLVTPRIPGHIYQ